MSIYGSVNDIINRVASEVGFDVVTDPLTDDNKVFTQLRYLMNSAAEELIDMCAWTELQKEHTITTAATDDGSYTLPSDFKYMIPQTGWERNNNNEMLGPLSPQDWSYLKGRDLSSDTIYASFRLKQREYFIFPNDPVVANLKIVFEYMSDNWLQNATQATTFYNEIQAGSNICMLPKTLMIKFLKCKYLEAKGFDSTRAREDFAVNYISVTGNDGSAAIVSAGGERGFPYLNVYRNVSDTGYGS